VTSQRKMTIHYLNRNPYTKKPKTRGFKFAPIKDNNPYKSFKRNHESNNFSGKNLTLQILSGAVLICFGFLFIQSFLVGTTTTASASALSTKEIQLFTNFKNEQANTNTKISTPTLEEINVQFSSSSLSSSSSVSSTSVARAYVVIKGDTIFDISKKTEVSLIKLISANNIDDSGSIAIGQTLIIP